MALYGIKDSANLTLFSKKTGKPVLYADYCNQTSLNMSADVVYAMKKTARAISWDTSKEGTLTTEMQVFDLRWIALLMGSLDDLTAAPSALEWAKREIIEAGESGAIPALHYEPKDATATLYKLGKDGISLGDEVDSTDFSISGKNITITGAEEGDKFCIFYLTEVEKSRKFTVSGDKYPNGYRVVFDTMIRDTDQQDHFVQFDFKNLRPKSQMELTMSAEDVCTLSVEWDVLVDNNNDFFTFIYLDEEYEDENNGGSNDNGSGSNDNGGSGTTTPTITADMLDEVTAEELAVSNVNPSTEGWFESDGNGGFVLTVDTEVDLDSDKTYYKLKTSG